jgi:hypothetical protein
MDQHAARLQEAPLLARDLSLHPLVIAPPRVRRTELRRPEETAVLHAIERGGRQEIERARLTEVDEVVLEQLAVEIAAVERHRIRTELEQ